MATIVRIGEGRSKRGKILDRNTKWFTISDKEAWERCVHEWSLKENSGKPLFISRNGRAYKKISGVDLIKLKDKL
jgi:hypothetical protein